MSSWAKSPAGGRRAPGAPNGSAQQLRVFRRAAPYPSREERTDDLKDALESYEELEQIQNFTSTVKFEAFKHQPAAIPDACTPADRHQALYQKFYRQVLEERKPPDCVVLSVTNEFLDYPKSLSQCLQERGLSVEMLFLPAEAGLTRALQDVRADGCPLCILVEQKNVALSSCTIIIFSESLKIHRNMPKDQALDLVQSHCGLAAGRPPPDPAEAAARASQLVDDFLEREAAARHTVPTATRRLLRLLADGVHLYPEELEAVSEYVASRLEHVEALSSSADGDGTKAPSSLGKPPPLLPTPPGPPQLAAVAGGSPPAPVPLLPTPAFPKSKPPPLLSLHRHPGPLGPPPPRGVPHNLFGPPGGPRGPLLPHPPPFHPRGPHGPRLTPPSLKSSRPPLLSTPGPPLPRLSGPRH